MTICGDPCPACSKSCTDNDASHGELIGRFGDHHHEFVYRSSTRSDGLFAVMVRHTWHRIEAAAADGMSRLAPGPESLEEFR